MMKHFSLLVVGLVCLHALPLAAQRKLVIPRGLKVANTHADNVLLDRSGLDPERALQGQFWSTKADAGKVVSIAFRPLSGNAYSLPAFHVDAIVGFSTVTKHARSISYKLADNRGKDFRIYFSGRVSFPAIPAKFRAVSPFLFKFPLQRPFSMPGDKWIVWDFHVLKTSLPATVGTKTAAGQIDTYSPVAPVDPRYTVQMFGSPCPRPSFNPSNVCLSSKLAVGSFFTVWNSRGDRVPSTGALGLIWLGASKSRWLGFKLPLDLTALGAKGCKIYVSMDYLWLPFYQSGVANTASSAMLPMDSRLIGKTVYFQAMALGVLNPLGIETSNGVAAKIGPATNVPYSVVKSYAPGLSPKTMWPYVGVPSAAYHPVMQLEIK